MMVSAISIALSGLESASKKLNASANNIANLHTVGSLEEGGQPPYTPQTTQQTALENGGVQTNIVQQQNNPFVPSYDPDSPFADENGIIGVPNVDLATEAVKVNLAELEYKANIGVLQTARELSSEIFRIFDEKV